MPKVIQDGGQFLGASVLTLGDDGRVGIPPVHGEPMEPHVVPLQVGLLQAWIEAVDLTSRPGQRILQGPVVHAQPATHTAQAIWLFMSEMRLSIKPQTFLVI